MSIVTSKSVQFTDAESVVAAYMARECPAFGIWQGSQFNFKYEGKDINDGAQRLAAFCDLLNQSAAVYTLTVYEEIEGRINSKTPYHGSFNFRLQQDTVAYNNGGMLLRGMSEKIAAMELELKKDPEPPPSILGQIGEVLQDPTVKEYLPMILGLFGVKNVPGQQLLPGSRPAAMAGVPGTETERDQILRESIEILKRYPDKIDIVTVLHTLAVLSSTNPIKFAMVCEAVKSFQV